MSDQKRPLLSRSLLLFMGTMILANISGAMYEPLLPLYLQDLGADIGKIGLFFTLSAIAPLAFQILGGWLSDVIGRLQAIAIGSLAGVLGYFVFVFAPSWEWLLLATAAGAMAGSFVAPSYRAFIAEESSEETRGRVYGISEALYMIVGILGPPIGGYLSQYMGFRSLFIIAGALYACATVIRLFMARASKVQREPGDQPTFAKLKSSLWAIGGMILAGGVVTWIFLTDGIQDVTFRMVGQLLPVYMQNLAGITNVQIGWMSSMSAMATMLLVMPGGWLSDRTSERVGLSVGFSIISLALGVFLGSNAFFGFAASWILFGAGVALLQPAYSSLISKAVPENLRGTAFGLFSTSIGIISLPSPYLGALLWERFSPQTPFYIPLIATIVMIPVMWFKFRPDDNQAPPDSKPVDPHNAAAL